MRHDVQPYLTIVVVSTEVIIKRVINHIFESHLHFPFSIFFIFRRSVGSFIFRTRSVKSELKQGMMQGMMQAVMRSVQTENDCRVQTENDCTNVVGVM